MTLPTSGPLSLNDIKGEFGGPTSPSLGDYYAGGSYVPAGTSGTNGAVPSTGTISISNFYGTSNAIIAFDDAYVSVTGYFQATAGYNIYGSGAKIGTVDIQEDATLTFYQQWATPTSISPNYEVYFSYVGTAPSGSAVNTWLTCSSALGWYLQSNGVQVKSTTLSGQVRKVGTTTVLDTWNVYLYAESYL